MVYKTHKHMCYQHEEECSLPHSLLNSQCLADSEDYLNIFKAKDTSEMEIIQKKGRLRNK